MNLAVIERMLHDVDLSRESLRYLLECRGECEWLDYKESLSLENDQDLCGFARDVLAFKNVGGGYIVVGVKDQIWDPIGLPKRLPYDSKMLRDKTRRSLGLDLDIDIVHHELPVGEASRLFAHILTRASKKRKKRRTPTVVAKDFCHTQPFGVRRGEIYVRRGDTTVKLSSQSELEELLDSLESQADEDALRSGALPSPFAIEEGTYRLLESGFERFIGREELRRSLQEAVTRDPRIWIINVHGPGGVGKSALVNWVTYEFYRLRTFEAIIQLTGKESILTQSGIRPFGRSLYSLENLLDHILNTFQESPPLDLPTKKRFATEVLSAWTTLLVLDNMETVSDGRILTFIQELPPSTRTKVLLTSRHRTGGWEFPVPVSELNYDETAEFVKIKSDELRITFPTDERILRRVHEVTGGLPLAIQWVIGQHHLSNDADAVLSRLSDKDSPILEYSFRNVWNILDSSAKAILAILSIFEAPPNLQQLTIATNLPKDEIEEALTDLTDVTLVTRVTQQSDGSVLYAALPITLSFARNQLGTMGDYELRCRQRVQIYTEQMTLQESEMHRFRSIFERYGMVSDNERRAAILCRRAESDMFSGNVENADLLFRQARDIAPQSAYVHAMSASYELARNRVGAALERVEEACARANNRTGGLCYGIKARVMDVQRDRWGRVNALERALQYEPDDVVLRHQYGVALSRAGQTNRAIEVFSSIIDEELTKFPARATLLMALTTRIINLRRIGRWDDATRDLATAKALLEKNPHLVHAAQRISALEDDEA